MRITRRYKKSRVGQWFLENFMPFRAVDAYKRANMPSINKELAAITRKTESIRKRTAQYDKEADEIIKAISEKPDEPRLSAERKRLDALSLKTDSLRRESTLLDNRVERYKKEYDVFDRYHDGLIDKASRKAVVIVSVICIGFVTCVYICYKVYAPMSGKNIGNDFYTTIAQIAPTILVALFLTDIRKPGKKATEDVSIWRRLMVDSRILGILGFVIAEIGCLVALSRGSSGVGTFTFAYMGILFVTVIAILKIIERE